MYDYLIVGQGLAGTILSYQLMKKGKNVFVINAYDTHCSSYIAAGLFSPITGQRLAKIQHADVALPYAHTFYRELEQVLQCHFFHPMPYIKILHSSDAVQTAYNRLQDASYATTITSTTFHEQQALVINNAGYLNIPALLDNYRAYLIKQDRYKEEYVDNAQLTVTDRCIHYKEIQAEYLIFCNGLQAGENPYFNHLRFNPTKGELLKIHTTTSLQAIVSNKAFLLPLKDNIAYIGATYERNYKDIHPTTEARNWLINELKAITSSPYEIIEHRVGIRPTTFGHQPFMQWHHLYNNIGIFSGFGSKGLSLIPYLSHIFATNM